MEAKWILLTEYCRWSETEPAFLEELESEGLIQVSIRETQKYIDEEQLDRLERFRRWHYEMDVNVQGIDAMHYLVGKIERLNREVRHLEARLKLHERL